MRASRVGSMRRRQRAEREGERGAGKAVKTGQWRGMRMREWQRRTGRERRERRERERCRLRERRWARCEAPWVRRRLRGERER